MTHALSDTLQSAQATDGCEYVGRIGPLLASRLDPATLPTFLQPQIEQATLRSVRQEPTAKFAEHGEIKAGFGQLQAIG